MAPSKIWLFWPVPCLFPVLGSSGLSGKSNSWKSKEISFFLEFFTTKLVTSIATAQLCQPRPSPVALPSPLPTCLPPPSSSAHHLPIQIFPNCAYLPLPLPPLQSALKFKWWLHLWTSPKSRFRVALAWTFYFLIVSAQIRLGLMGLDVIAIFFSSSSSFYNIKKLFPWETSNKNWFFLVFPLKILFFAL